MPYFLLALLGRVLIWIAAGVVYRALAALGFAYLTYTGIGGLMDKIESHIKSLSGNVAPEIAQILGIAKFDVAINIILAAMAARLFLVGMDKVTDSITRIGVKGR